MYVIRIWKGLPFLSGTQSSFFASLSLNEIIPSWHVTTPTVHSSSLYRSAAWHLMFGLTPAGPECPLLSPGLKWLSASTGPSGSATTPSAPQPESEYSFLSEPSTPIISWRYELLNSLLPRKMTSSHLLLTVDPLALILTSLASFQPAWVPQVCSFDHYRTFLRANLCL